MSHTRTPLLSKLPDFPWDALSEAKATANEYPDGIIDLSVGTPVDPVVPRIQAALEEHAEIPGYPQTIGTVELRQSIIDSLQRRYNVSELEQTQVLPAIGTKEAIGTLAFWLGLGAEDTVVIPSLAYPTYEVAAASVDASVVRADSPEEVRNLGVHPALVFINSPANPTGKILSDAELKVWVEYARTEDVIVASDECYIGLGYAQDVSTVEGTQADQSSLGVSTPRSILDDSIIQGDATNLLAIHSLSKSSNMASYRVGFYAGDAALVSELAQVRRHCGMILPLPIQDAMTCALQDDEQEALQKKRYVDRRDVLAPALKDAGFDIAYSQAGLYLWATQGKNCWETVEYLAQLGILVAPGEFYGTDGTQFVRIALTNTDEKIAEAAQRLRGSGGAS